MTFFDGMSRRCTYESFLKTNSSERGRGPGIKRGFNRYISRVRMGSGVVGIGSVCDSNCTGNHVYCRYALCAIHCMWDTIRFELMGGIERGGREGFLCTYTCMKFESGRSFEKYTHGRSDKFS